MEVFPAAGRLQMYRKTKEENAVTIKEREEDLFYHWQREQGYDCFIKDGIFDEEEWKGPGPKITFVLKEANRPGVSDDLCWKLVHKPHPSNWKTWNNVARWTKALLDDGEYPGCISTEERIKQLRRVSFLNLKKAGGGPGAVPEEIRKAAKADAFYIRKQLLLYEPDIIICCGKWIVADVLKKEVLEREELPGGAWPVLDREEAEQVSWFHTRLPEQEKLTPVADFYHPEWFTGGHRRWREWFGQMKALRALLLPPS